MKPIVFRMRLDGDIPADLKYVQNVLNRKFDMVRVYGGVNYE